MPGRVDIMDLQINIADIFSFITNIFSNVWPILAVIIAIKYSRSIYLIFDEIREHIHDWKVRRRLKKMGYWKW